ncbi:unnamed protein product [Amoebophrya sp. A25]|nr:unnamed protein product [Amoebophrya sp. A25]|eukprot:GSA25T00014962001.1
MRLLTHNLLMCNKKGVENGFPLKIKPQRVIYEETEYNPTFTTAMIRKIEYPALLEAIEDLRSCSIVREDGGPQQINADSSTKVELPSLPKEMPVNWETNEEFLQMMHLVLQDVLLMDGALICPESGRAFPVEKGIPNMLLHDDEI